MRNTTIARDAADRQAEAEALHASIVELVQQLADSGQWRAFLDFARSFHNYSLNNLLLILAQNPGAPLVARAKEVFPNVVDSELLLDCRHTPPFTDAFRERLCGRIAAFLSEA